MKQVERQRGMPAAGMSALLEVLAGRDPSEGAEDLALNDYMIQGTGGLRLVRPDTSGELAPLVQELIEWRLAETPIIRELAESATTFVGKPESLELWQRYFVPDIASFFSEDYQQNLWRMGIKTLPKKKIMILLANVAKQDLAYPNEFLGPSRMKWFSQDQTKQRELHGRIISGTEGHEVHLFVRRGNKVNGKVNPFIYFGKPKFAGWTGETPIEVLWDLPTRVPEELWAELGVPEVI